MVCNLTDAARFVLCYPSENIVLGGRDHLFDPTARQSLRTIGFTACFSTQGQFEFMSLADIAKNDTEYRALFKQLLESTLERTGKSGTPRVSLTLHLPKDLSNDERSIVRDVVARFAAKIDASVSALRITDENELFGVADDSTEGLPERGTVVRV